MTLTRRVKALAGAPEGLPEGLLRGASKRKGAPGARRLAGASQGGAALAAALLALGCGAAQPSALDAAEAACELEIRAVIQAGECDTYAQLEACPAYILTQAHCWRMLLAAERQAQGGP